MILVTGASEGIGFACARELLARTPASVLATGRSLAKLAGARDSLPPPARERFCTLASDQARGADVRALVSRLAGAATIQAAILTVGVNPAYAEGPRRLHALSAETIEETVRTNCIHTMLLTTALLDRFRRQRAGVLVWIGSQAQATGLSGAGLYNATKSFLSGLARTAHNEYGARGVRVHLAHPGLVRTPRTAAVADAFARRHGLQVSDASQVARQIVDLMLDGDPCAVEVNLC
ncbi:MAG TPA: SDR family oxidoreductase [Gemmatimonadales bacterium]|jgi:short-subunit dehydrogenase|nr:SDR family oxidoreductase [Gemmatimonadales bacterium]